MPCANVILTISRLTRAPLPAPACWMTRTGSFGVRQDLPPGGVTLRSSAATAARAGDCAGPNNGNPRLFRTVTPQLSICGSGSTQPLPSSDCARQAAKRQQCHCKNNGNHKPAAEEDVGYGGKSHNGSARHQDDRSGPRRRRNCHHGPCKQGCGGGCDPIAQLGCGYHRQKKHGTSFGWQVDTAAACHGKVNAA